MSQTHDVSVVIPCYRQARFLGAAIESVLAQTHPGVEIVVVNDGSDDDTEAVASRYLSQIRYVSKKNGGNSSARNAGIERAGGRYLLFLDADDLLHPEAIARLAGAVEGRDDLMAVMGYRFVVDSAADGDLIDRLPDRDELSIPKMLRTNVTPIHCVLVPRSAVVAVGRFQETLNWHEDWDLWLRVALEGVEIRTVPFVGAYYRRHPGSQSTNNVRMAETRAQVLIKTHQRICGDPKLLTSWGDALARVEICYLRHLLLSGVGRGVTRALFGNVRELRRLGFAPPRSRMKALAERLAGVHAESLSLALMRRSEPDLFALYRDHWVW